MFEHLSLTQLPRVLQDLVQQTTASDQARREKRRSVLLREIRAEEAAVADQAREQAGGPGYANERQASSSGPWKTTSRGGRSSPAWG